MPDEVIDFSTRRSCPKINSANRITAAVPAIRRAVAVAGIGRFRHPNSQIPHRHGRRCELQSLGPTGAVLNRATRKRQPRPFRGLLNGIFARPVLHEIMPRKELSPSDADRIDRMTRCQIDDNPLRILRVIFSGECLTQIRIAFPLRVCAAVRYARESVLIGAIVAGETTMRQKISERVPDKIARLRVPYKEPLAAGIAPCALRIPVPRLNK